MRIEVLENFGTLYIVERLTFIFVDLKVLVSKEAWRYHPMELLRSMWICRNAGSALIYISSKLEYERNLLFWATAGAEMQVYLVLFS